MKRLFVLVVFSLGLLCVGGSVSGQERARPSMESFSGKSLKGKRIKSSAYEGQVLVISFWAAWCSNCQKAFPFLEGISRAHEDEGLAVLTIATDNAKTVAQVRSLVKRKRWTLPVILDMDGAIFARFSPRTVIPYTVFVDHTGHIAFVHEGFAKEDEAQLKATLTGLLKERQSATR